MSFIPSRSSQLDEAVRSFNNPKSERLHAFENLVIDHLVVEVCRDCGKYKDEVRKEGSTYALNPCRGLVG